MKQLTGIVLAAALLGSGFAGAQTAPYAGQQLRSIKSLSDQEVRDLLDGKGMGLAKAAELNGYPGPAHVLEHGKALALSPAQREASTALMQRHQARAREIGARLVEAERALDAAFATRSIDEQQLAALTAQIGKLQAEVRAEHLATHLAQTALLQPEQIRHYAQLRGYAAETPAPSAAPAAAPAGHRHTH